MLHVKFAPTWGYGGLSCASDLGTRIWVWWPTKLRTPTLRRGSTTTVALIVNILDSTRWTCCECFYIILCGVCRLMHLWLYEGLWSLCASEVPLCWTSEVLEIVNYLSVFYAESHIVPNETLGSICLLKVVHIVYLKFFSFHCLTQCFVNRFLSFLILFLMSLSEYMFKSENVPSLVSGLWTCMVWFCCLCEDLPSKNFILGYQVLWSIINFEELYDKLLSDPKS